MPREKLPAFKEGCGKHNKSGAALRTAPPRHLARSYSGILCLILVVHARLNGELSQRSSGRGNVAAVDGLASAGPNEFENAGGATRPWARLPNNGVGGPVFVRALEVGVIQFRVANVGGGVGRQRTLDRVEQDLGFTGADEAQPRVGSGRFGAPTGSAKESDSIMKLPSVPGDGAPRPEPCGLQRQVPPRK